MIAGKVDTTTRGTVYIEPTSGRFIICYGLEPFYLKDGLDPKDMTYKEVFKTYNNICCLVTNRKIEINIYYKFKEFRHALQLRNFY